MLTFMVDRQVSPELMVRVEAVVAVFLTETRARETLTLSTMESEPQVVPEVPEQSLFPSHFQVLFSWLPQPFVTELPRKMI
jgi:hypothetical protein